MVSAYSSASSTSTPRALSVVIADDASQNALSTFIGVFIYSVVALVALKNSDYQKTELFVLFVPTLLALTIVIITFLRWVDRIARLGRMGSVIDKVESTTFDTLMNYGCYRYPTMKGLEITADTLQGVAVRPKEIGYKKHCVIAASGDEAMKAAALYQARRAFFQAEKSLQVPEDINAVKSAGLLK